MKGRVSKLVLENLNLSGSLNGKSLNQLDQLRVLSFKGNSLSGSIPNLSGIGFPARFLARCSDSPAFTRFTFKTISSLVPFLLSTKQLSDSLMSRIINSLIQNSCNDTTGITSTPSAKPAIPVAKTRSRTKLIGIISGSICGGILILLLTFLLICLLWRRKRSKSKREERRSKRVAESKEAKTAETEEGTSDQKNKRFSWEKESEEGSVGTLVFLGRDITVVRYTMDDLLKASAETLGRGTLGSTYKAVMESGFIITVKRLKDAGFPRMDEFKRHIEILGRLKHPNLVPLRAYFQAKEECLLVYDYFPNGSLFSLIHGSKVSGSGKPLHWTSCLKIAEDLAMGLVYIHQNPGLTHGNLKSSNVLLGPDFESCLTDYGLSDLHDPYSIEDTSAASLFYKAPECRDLRKASTQPADVYSFGVLLLELLTGRTSFKDLVHKYGSDISTWVRAVREEETEVSEELNASEEKLQALLTIATACVAVKPENRPAMREVLKMVKDARAEAALFSFNSSDHSPGRWSDTIQSLPREDHMSI